MYPKVDFFIGLFLVVFSAIGFLIADQLPEAQKGLGPGDYPKVVLSALFILGLIQTAYSYYTWRRNVQLDERKFEKGELQQIFLLVLCVGLYIWLVRYFGFIILTPIFMFLMMYIFGLRKWIKMTVISLSSVAIIYIIFNNFLYVLLPRFNLY